MQRKELGARLTRWRKRRNLSVTQLAARTGVDYMQISRYEKGQSMPALDTAARIARILQISLDELATGTVPPTGFRSTPIFERMRELDELPPDRQDLALRVLETIIAGHELGALGERLRRSL